MRILTTLPQDDLTAVPAAARAAEAAGYDGVVSGGYGVHQHIPPDLIQDIRRIPSAFTGFETSW